MYTHKLDASKLTNPPSAYLAAYRHFHSPGAPPPPAAAAAVVILVVVLIVGLVKAENGEDEVVVVLLLLLLPGEPDDLELVGPAAVRPVHLLEPMITSQKQKQR